MYESLRDLEVYIGKLHRLDTCCSNNATFHFTIYECTWIPERGLQDGLAAGWCGLLRIIGFHGVGEAAQDDEHTDRQRSRSCFAAGAVRGCIRRLLVALFFSIVIHLHVCRSPR